MYATKFKHLFPFFRRRCQKPLTFDFPSDRLMEGVGLYQLAERFTDVHSTQSRIYPH